MADEIPYSIAEQLLSKMGSHVFEEIATMYGVEDDLKKLRDSLSFVGSLLLDAEEEQAKSHPVGAWVGRLREIIYDADDLFDDIATERMRKKALGPQSMARKVSDLFCLKFRYKVGPEIRNIKERLIEVEDDIVSLNFEKRDIICRETESFVRQSEIIGREKDKENIIESLMVNYVGNEAHITVVAIVGFGGLGKTALAQLVYNDEKVDKDFGVRMWVCVSEDFHVKLIIKKILRCIITDLNENLDLEQLQRKLRENLGGQRYFLVLDDVWNEDGLKWDDLRKYLSVGAPGSKILVTTRSKKVALVVGAESSYDLKGLEEEKAWDLFQKLAFSSSSVAVNPNLITIGKEIVKKCKGVPLALRALGKLMQLKKGSEWSSILENDLWMSFEREGYIFPVLKLSYNHLPLPLRQCFAYCAMFPKDYKFDKVILVRLWMAQGYIVGAGSRNECLEEIGEQYFDELLFRSFFEIIDGRFGKEYYKMHDLIHDLARSLSKDSCIVVEENNMENISERNQHIHWRGAQNEQMKRLAGVKGMRTLFVEKYGDAGRHLDIVAPNCQSLRALHWHWLSEVPKSIGKLKHLRYLDLSESTVKTLPKSITKLHNLQNLILDGCNCLLELPRDIQNLISLSCLMIDRCWGLQGMPRGLGKLTCLQRLSNFIVGNGKGELNELEHLNQLRGSLIIDGLKDVRSCELEAKKVNLLAKEHLQHLKLNWAEGGGYLVKREIKSAAEESELAMLLEKLQPHPNLQELYVIYYPGVRFSNWLPQITHLVKLKLHLCPNLKQISPLDQLPSLQTLFLWWLEAVEYISDEDEVKESSFESEDESCSLSEDEISCAVFQKLQDIDIGFCSSLKGWWRRRRRNDFPSLSRLYIRECNDLTSLRELGMHQLTSLQELTISNCPMLAERCEKEKGVDWPIISHVPKFTIEPS